MEARATLTVGWHARAAGRGQVAFWASGVLATVRLGGAGLVLGLLLVSIGDRALRRGRAADRDDGREGLERDAACWVTSVVTSRVRPLLMRDGRSARR